MKTSGWVSNIIRGIQAFVLLGLILCVILSTPIGVLLLMNRAEEDLQRIENLEQKVALQRECIETLEDNITTLRDTLKIEY